MLKGQSESRGKPANAFFRSTEFRSARKFSQDCPRHIAAFTRSHGKFIHGKFYLELPADKDGVLTVTMEIPILVRSVRGKCVMSLKENITFQCEYFACSHPGSLL